MKVMALGTLVVLGVGPVSTKECVLFDAATTPRARVAAQDGATLDWKPDFLTVRTSASSAYPGFTVEGPWNLSAYGEIAVEFVGGAQESRCTVRLLNPGGRPDGKGCFITKFTVKPWRAQTRSQVIPPERPSWRGIQAELKGIRTWALPYLLWNTNTADVALWNHEDVPVATLDRRNVAQVAVYVNTPSSAITPLDGRETWFARLPEPDSPEALFYTTQDELLAPYYGRHGFTRTYDFSAQNIRRKYGADWFATWADLAHRRLRSWGCNTIANSSDRSICLMDRTPYTERFEVHSKPLAGHTGGWWDFADPFDPSFRAEARRQTTEVFKREFADPWCLGFFVDNEQHWGEPHTLGVSTLKSPADQAAKRVLCDRLKAKYETVAALNAAWRTVYADWDGFLAETVPPTDLAGAKADLAAFAMELAETYYRVIKEEIKRANPGKLYLGCRYAGVPKDFVVRAAAQHCDVISYNIYTKNPCWFKLPEGVDKPVLIGEFHFGALDRGPFCPGLILLKDQKERAKVYGEYVRGALAHPNLVGVHWHQFSDQATSGRFDGENMQVGWTDVRSERSSGGLRMSMRRANLPRCASCRTTSRLSPSSMTAPAPRHVI